MDTQFDGESIYKKPDRSTSYRYSDRGVHHVSSGWTIVMKWVVLARKHPELVQHLEKYLITHPAKVDRTINREVTALIIACLCADTVSSNDVVRVLVRAGANVNHFSCSYGKTTLMFAHEFPSATRTETMQILIDAGADVNIKNFNNDNLLMLALKPVNRIVDHDVVELLIRSKSNLDICNKDGHYPLLMCMNYEHPSRIAFTKLLLDAGANVNLTNAGQNNILIKIPKYISDRNSCFDDDFCEYVKMLIRAGADVNNCGEFYNTPLTESSRYATPENNLWRFSKTLIENSAELNSFNKEGNTALLLAVGMPVNISKHLVKVLIDAGCKIDFCNNTRHSAVMYAAFKRSRDVVEMFIEAGCDLNLINNERHSVLDLAVKHNNENTMSVLVENYARCFSLKLPEKYRHCRTVFHPNIFHNCSKIMRDCIRMLMYIRRYCDIFAMIPREVMYIIFSLI